VRRTLSYSLHDLARILGRELTTAQLLPTFDRFLKVLLPLPSPHATRFVLIPLPLPHATRHVLIPLPTFDRLPKDLDEVKVGVIQHLCAFLAVLDDGTRLECAAPPMPRLASPRLA